MKIKLFFSQYKYFMCNRASMYVEYVLKYLNSSQSKYYA